MVLIYAYGKASTADLVKPLNSRLNQLIVKYNIGFKKTLRLQHGISEPVFYGDLVYKFKIIVEKPNSSDQCRKIIKRYKKDGYNMESCVSLHVWL